MRLGQLDFSCNSSIPMRISEAQRNFLNLGTYEILSTFGSCFFRKLQIIGADPGSGNLLIKESYSGKHPYNKLFVLSPDGRSEKYRGQTFCEI